MNINLENLFYMVYEHFDNTSEYHRIRLECWEKQNGQLRKLGMTPKNCTLYVDHLDGKYALSFGKHYERVNCGERAISDLCGILGIDETRLYGMVKAIKKWHDKREWQIGFPFTEGNSKAILDYIKA